MINMFLFCYTGEQLTVQVCVRDKHWLVIILYSLSEIVEHNFLFDIVESIFL